MGHSISYHTAEETETTPANAIATSQFATPNVNIHLPGLAPALALNNYDENTETLSGSGTAHDTVLICHRNIQEKRLSRVFTKEQKALEPYRKKPK